MTENERVLRDIIIDGNGFDYDESIPQSIFEEIQQYRELGTIEEFKALKEKSMARKPLPKGTHKGIDNFYCPNCNHPLTNRHEQCELTYCDICGQRLDWGE